MEFIHSREIEAKDCTHADLHVKQEPQEPVSSVMATNSASQRIKNELASEERKRENPHKKRKLIESTKKAGDKNALGNSRIQKKKKGRSDFTQLPCIVNIKSSAVLGKPRQKNYNEISDTLNGIPNTSSESSTSESTFSSKVYEILVDIQRTLKDLKTEVAENSQKIDLLQTYIPQPLSWQSTKNDFNFPVSTEEQLLELEKQLEDNEIATKLVLHLTSKTFISMREMVLLCLKYMISRNVAVLYNLNGVKGTKKKFRDLNVCNILVECVQYKFKEATALEILKRISFILAGARDWQGLRHKKD